MSRAASLLAAAPLAAVALAACSAPGRSGDMLRLAEVRPTAHPGLATFLYDDFGGLSAATMQTSTVPYKVVATVLLMEQERREGRRLGRRELPRVFRQFGFLTGDRIANWRGPAPPR